MIGKLKGIIDSIENGYILLDVSGVCYRVFTSLHSQSQLGEVGESASLLIETHVREDHIHLYGFATDAEKQWFNLLTTVKGVGTKMGMAFLSILSPSQISIAIASQDTNTLIQVSGVGKKLAERVITELKDKVGKLPTVDGNLSASNINTTKSSAIAENQTISDAISALTNLGYNRSDVYIAVNKLVEDNADITLEDLIRTALGEL